MKPLRTAVSASSEVRSVHGLQLDVTAVLTFWMLLLYGINARMVIPGFGAIGQPATLVALGALLWWLSARCVPQLGMDQGHQPVRYALAVYALYLTASYGMASMRTLTALERSSSTRGMITLAALFGVAALAADGIDSLDRLRGLLRRLVTFGALFAGFGLIQALVGESLLVLPPGLQWNAEIPADIEFRLGEIRPLATALHPIEYAVVAASLVPLAIHFVLYPSTRSDPVRAIIETSILLVAVFISLSRTGPLSLVVGLVVLAFGWTWRRRINVALVSLMVVPAIAAAVPWAYRVMVDMFTSGLDGSDYSVQARLDRLPQIMALIRDRPLFGTGYGTLTPEEYLLIDNQLWGTLISIGFVGLVLTVGLLLTAGVTAAQIRFRSAATAESMHLGRAIAGSIAAIGVSFATFDALFYRILVFTLFLLIGSAGALWRLTGPAVAPSPCSLGSKPAST